MIIFIKSRLTYLKENALLKDEIMKIYNESNKVYGAPKIQKELEGKGYKVSVKRVQRKMKELGIDLLLQRNLDRHVVLKK